MLFFKDNVQIYPIKIIYLSDGSVAQFKNEDFNIVAELNFLATSHGNGQDGLSFADQLAFEHSVGNFLRLSKSYL